MRYYKREIPANKDNAKANLLNAERLTTKSERVNALGQAAARLERKIPKTREALNHLGAGQPYGA